MATFGVWEPGDWGIFRGLGLGSIGPRGDLTLNPTPYP